MVKLGQCDHCAKLQAKYREVFLCSNCFNPTNSSNKIPQVKKPYHHTITLKFENVTKTLNMLMDRANEASLITNPKRKFSVTQDYMGSLEDLQTYEISLNMLNTNLTRLTKIETNFNENLVITKMLDLFTQNILSSCTVCLPQKIDSILEPKPKNKILLYAILCRSEFLYKSLKPGSINNDNKNNNPIEGLFFYQTFKNYVATVNTIYIELIQAILLIADLETSTQCSLAHLNSIKATKYAQMLYLHDETHVSHTKDNLVVKVEKFLTWASCTILELRVYYYNPQPKAANHSWQLSSKHLNDAPPEFKKWINHVHFMADICEYNINGIEIKNSITSTTTLELAENPWDLKELEKLTRLIDFIQDNPVCELLTSYFESHGKHLDPYHTAITMEFITFHIVKIFCCELFEKILNSPNYLKFLPPIMIEIMKQESQSKLEFASKILKFANEDHGFQLLTSSDQYHLEMADYLVPWAYFFALRIMVNQNQISFNHSEMISTLTKKLRAMSKVWPTTKDMMNIVELDLQAHGIALTYHDVKMITNR